MTVAEEGVLVLQKAEYPILEYDTEPSALINPQDLLTQRFDTDKLVITFFPEALRRMAAEGTILPAMTIDGENPIEIYRFADAPDVLVTLGQVGCPACAGNLDLFQAMGAKKVMFCGGGGVLDPDIAVGQLLVVEGAIRDEGFSYHYVAPSRTIAADRGVTDRIAAELEARGIPYLRGMTWTTDAMLRETPQRIALRREEGARIVEMEQAGCLAVAQVRGFTYGALIYGGDDVSDAEWSNRGWRSRDGIRYNLVLLCRELVQLI